MDELTFITLQVPKSLAHKARVVAAMLDMSRSELVRRAMTRELKRLEDSNGQQERTREVSYGDG